jgi:hypothetical protein
VYLTGHGGNKFLKFQDVEELMAQVGYLFRLHPVCSFPVISKVQPKPCVQFPLVPLPRCCAVLVPKLVTDRLVH